MRPSLLLCTLAFALTASPALFPSETPSDSPAHTPFTHEQIIETWGRIVARETHADQFDLSEPEHTALIQGLTAGSQKHPAPYPLDKIYNDVTQFVETRNAALRQTQKDLNLATFPAYFEALQKLPDIVTLPSGLCYQILLPGEGPSPRADQTVRVKYHAHLIDGTVFDSTEQLGPVDIVLSKIIPGWTEGIQKLRLGGKIRLHIPPALAFTDADALMLGIPPASIVVSEIELLAIKDTPPEEPPPPAAPVPPPPAPAGFSNLQIIETWGWLLASERGLTQAQLSPTDHELFIKGLTAALTHQAPSIDEQKIYPHVAQFVAERQQAYAQAVREKRLAESAAFFETLKQTPNVKFLSSGLAYEILKSGSGPFPKPDQRVLVNYTGTLIDGTVFDHTDPAMGPLEVDIGHVVAGWSEGIQKINQGGRIKLYIPPALAYGDNATGAIPATSTLIFEIELLKISDRPPEELPAATSTPPVAQ